MAWDTTRRSGQNGHEPFVINGFGGAVKVLAGLSHALADGCFAGVVDRHEDSRTGLRCGLKRGAEHLEDESAGPTSWAGATAL
ncbi:hypothetical protein [Streptomyces sp. NPDC002403]